MKHVSTFANDKHIKLWLEDLDFSAFQQAVNVVHHPATFRHVAIMPDAHLGVGVPIGCVFASKDCVVPNAVGVDIGCGMTAIRLNIKEMCIRRNADAIINSIKNSGILSVRRDYNSYTFGIFSRMKYTKLIDHDVRSNLTRQLGTLGGGNHFIEFQRDDMNQIWLMIHSGSRNLGQVIGKHYDKIASDLNTKWKTSVSSDEKLAFLPLDSTEGQNYITDMNFAVEYARRNRIAIINNIIDILKSILGEYTAIDDSLIDSVHNFAAHEHHFGKNVLVHRKGATMARENQLALIPGSQGTSSYIVKGKGNRESFYSCSHGAGRVMSRSQAKKELDLEFEQLLLEEKNVIHDMNSISSLDEAPSAYKDIETVMKNQEDLVEIVTKLEPILVVKN